MINDGTGKAINCKVVVVEGTLCVFATKDIKSGTELRYDYGTTDLPWRKV